MVTGLLNCQSNLVKHFSMLFFFLLVIEQKRRLKGRRGCGILFMADDTVSVSASASDSASPFCSCSHWMGE